MILLVEDDPGDVELTRRALESHRVGIDLRVVSDGEEALDYLQRRGSHGDAMRAPRPDLLLIDLNLPRMGGRRLLAELQHDALLSRIPAIVLTTSDDDDDVRSSYALGACSHIRKPQGIPESQALFAALQQYWFEIVTLPGRVPS